MNGSGELFRWRSWGKRSAAVALATVLGADLAGCSGSSSESPWPVEPSNTEPGPAGEQVKKGVPVDELPNRYGAGGADEGREPPEPKGSP
jgi:hypothetical protein